VYRLEADMALSISSFDFLSPVKVIATAAALIGAEWIWLPQDFAFDEENVSGAHTLNELILERYTYEFANKPYVLLGSSVLTHIPPPHCRPKNIASIFLQGRSAVTGLEAVRRVKSRPEVLFIESTTLLTGMDQDLLTSVFTPIYWHIRAFIPPLRNNRNLLIMFYRWALYNPAQYDPVKLLPRESVQQWNEAHAAGFNAYMREFRMDNQISGIVGYVVTSVRELQEKGTRVIVFFPADLRIKELSPHKQIQSALRAELPDIQMVDPPDQEFPVYRSDGMHLEAASGLQVFEYLMRVAELPFVSHCTAMSPAS
jgi:hypothetical protein